MIISDVVEIELFGRYLKHIAYIKIRKIDVFDSIQYLTQQIKFNERKK